MVEQVWRDFHQQLLNYIVKQVGVVDVAEDILQDVFIKVNQRIAQIEDKEKLVSWLYTICRNTMYDYFRKNKTEQSKYLAVNMEDIISDEQDKSKQESLYKCITTLINELDESYRQVLKDSEINGLKQTLIAEKNHLSLSATKSRVGRGKIKLKEKLKRCCEFDFSESGVSHYCKRNCGCQ